jgi:hypothetical protein
VSLSHNISMAPRHEKARLPSEFDKCQKLDIVGGAVSKMAPVLQHMAVGHSASVFERAFSAADVAPFAFQSVRFNPGALGGPRWEPCFRFVAKSYDEIHRALFNRAVPNRWKCLYEVIQHNKPRNLYFDIELSRPLGTSREEHDRACWAKVQHLLRMVREEFRCRSTIIPHSS